LLEFTANIERLMRDSTCAQGEIYSVVMPDLLTIQTIWFIDGNIGTA